MNTLATLTSTFGFVAMFSTVPGETTLQRIFFGAFSRATPFA